METTYVLNRANKGLCWFGMIVSLGGLVGVSAMSVYLVRLLASGTSTPRTAVAILALFVCLVLAVQFAVLALRARRLLRFSVALSDEAIRVADTTITWEEIESIEHPKRTIGLAFCINTRDGRKIEVYPVENARQIEDTIRSKLPGN